MELPVRTNPRASRYNYASSGVYFVTICTKDRKEYFGKIVEKKMVLNEIGRICEEELLLTTTREGVNIVEWIIMPNHVHLLIHLENVENHKRNGCITPNVGTTRALSECNIPLSKYHNHPNENNVIHSDEARLVPTNKNDTNGITKITIQNQSLGSIIGSFKSSVSRQCHEKGHPFARQSRYHDHIIRNEQEYDHIKHYIHINPKKRKHDTFRIEM